MAQTAKKPSVNKFMQWHDSRLGRLALAVIELVLAYIVGGRALDTGSWWEYGFTLLLLIGFVKNLVHMIRPDQPIHSKARSTRKK